MNHPFKINDTVYHVARGQCEVENIDTHPRCVNSVYLKGYGWVDPGTLSFSTWVKADWERPRWKHTLTKGEALVVFIRHSGKFVPITVKEEGQHFVTDTSGKQFLKISCDFYPRVALKLQS